MADARGYQTRFGWRREAVVYTPTWPGTAIALDKILPFTSEGLTEELATEPNEEIDSQNSVLPSDIVSKRYNGPFTIDPISYEGLETLYASALGFEAISISNNDMPEELAVGAYRHLFECDHILSDRTWSPGEGWFCGEGLHCGQQKVRRGTSAIDKQVSVWEFRSSMFKSFIFRVFPPRVTLQLDTLSRDLDLASAVNTSGSMSSLASTINTNLHFKDAVLQVAPFSGVTPLGGGDAFLYGQFELTLDNNLADNDHTIDSGLFVESPQRSGSYSVTGSVTLPRYANDTQVTRYRNNTVLMGKLEFTGPQIGATGENYRMTIWLPSFTFNDSPSNVSGPGSIPEPHAFTVFRPASNPAGFPTNIKGGPLMIEVVSSVSAHPLL